LQKSINLRIVEDGGEGVSHDDPRHEGVGGGEGDELLGVHKGLKKCLSLTNCLLQP